MRDTDNFIFLGDAGHRFAPAEQLTYYEICLTLDREPLLGRQTGEMADLREAFSQIFERTRRKACRGDIAQPHQGDSP